MATSGAKGAEPASHSEFLSPEDVKARLLEVGYIADDEVATAIYLAQKLEKPILVEGPAGTGKTELAKAVAKASSRPLIRLQCYEGLDESKTLYEWDYKKQLLRLQAERILDEKAPSEWREVEKDIFSEEFLLERPLLKAIRSKEPAVLLIDEIDRIEAETEALLLEVLSDYQVSIPELGTITASSVPFTVLTSNGTRELSEALKRRCLFLYLDYPDLEREKEIVRTKLPGIDEELARSICAVVQALRSLELRKRPSISETLDWAKSLLELNIAALDDAVTRDTLWVLLKFRSDVEKALKELKLG